MTERESTPPMSTAEISADDLDRALRHEIERRGLCGLEAECVGDEDDSEGDLLTYTYDPEEGDETGLGFSMFVRPGECCGLSVGPIQQVIDLGELTLTAEEFARQVINAAQMLLNGQFALNVSARTDSDVWQAAELLWINDGGRARVTFTASMHEFRVAELVAFVLRNAEPCPYVQLRDGDMFCPPKVNGDYMVAREVDVEHPTPLSKDEYNALANRIPVLLMGGGESDSVWDVFYRRTEFWLISLLIGAPAVWVMGGPLDGHEWWRIIVRYVVGFIAFIAIAYLSGLALVHRQAVLDSGRTPLFERFERSLSRRVVAGVLVALYAGALLFLPLWTTRADPQRAQTTSAQPAVLPWVLGSIVTAVVAMVVITPVSRRHKVLRTVLMVLSFGLYVYANFVVMYGGEGAAEIGVAGTLLTLFIPVGTCLWYMFDCFRGIPGTKRREGPLAPWLLKVLAWPMLVGGLLWSTYVLVPRVVGVPTRSVAVSYTVDEPADQGQPNDSVYRVRYQYRTQKGVISAESEIDKRAYDRQRNEITVWYLEWSPQTRYAEIQTPAVVGVGGLFAVLGAVGLIGDRLTHRGGDEG